MKGGNGVSEANGITHSPTGEQNAAKCAYPNDAAENLPWMAPVSGAFASSADDLFHSQQPLLDRERQLANII